MTMPEHGGAADAVVVEGTLFALYSFDVGYEIDLDRLRRALPASERAGSGTSRKTASGQMEYPSPPLVLPAADRDVALGGTPRRAQVSLRAHEFGAVTVELRASLAGWRLAALPELTAALTGAGTLEPLARAVLTDARPSIAPAVERPSHDDAHLLEDYHVLQLVRTDPPVGPTDLLHADRQLLARILHGEPLALSATEVDDVLRTAVTYTPNDLVVTDWNAAVIVDDEWEDVLNVLELLNVQLVELRSLDAMLDRRITGLYERVARPPSLLGFRLERRRVRELAELWLDTVTLRERMTNALKLFGDLYLTKIHSKTAERLHLAEWQRALDAKLEIAQRIGDLSAARAATTRAELLELAIVVLIVVEILIFLPW
jgi:hypothetical protein